MYRLAAWVLLGAGGAAGQEMVTPGSPLERAIIDAFERGAGAPELKCSVRKFPPRLSFSFRYWSGFEVTISGRELEPRPAAALQILLRVTPRDGEPRYFYQRRPLPPLPADPRARKRVDLFASGSLALGTGEYEMSLQVSEAGGRVCRAGWRVTAPPAKVPLRLGPGEVADGAAALWRGMPEKPSAGLITIFLHAAPVFPRRTLTRLTPWDTAVLLGSLTSLLDTLPFEKARVAAYSLDNREILFTDTDFGPDGLARLAGRLEEVNFGLVSAAALRRLSPGEVLEQLLEQELANPRKADAVVFLGPPSRYVKRAPPAWKQYRARLPETIGVSVFPRAGEGGDVIQSLVKAVGGAMVNVYQPEDLARAVREISKVEAN